MPPSSRLSVNICPECKKRLEDYGQPACNLVKVACYYYLEGVPVIINMDKPEDRKKFEKPLEWLERDKKILSTRDIGNGLLALKPNASFIEEDGFKLFCWCAKL